MRTFKIALGAVLSALGLYFVVWCFLNPADAMPYPIFAVALIAAAVFLLVSGIRGETHSDSEDGEHYCHLHRHNPATERCIMCNQWTCDVGAHRDSYGRLICPLCHDKIARREYAEKNHIPYKSKTTAVLLAIFLGCLGIHRIYLGKNSGFVFLIITIFTFWSVFIPLILELIALIDLITIARGEWQDQYYRDLV